VNHNTQHALTVVNTDSVAVQLETVSHSPYQPDVSRRWRHNRRPGSSSIVHTSVVIVFGKLAVIISPDAKYSTDVALTRTGQCPLPVVLWRIEDFPLITMPLL